MKSLNCQPAFCENLNIGVVSGFVELSKSDGLFLQMVRPLIGPDHKLTFVEQRNVRHFVVVRQDNLEFSQISLLLF